MANPHKIHPTFETRENLITSNEMSNSPTRATAQQHSQNGTSSRGPPADGVYDPNACAGCDEQLKEGQALIALDRQWHISCFRFVLFLGFCHLAPSESFDLLIESNFQSVPQLQELQFHIERRVHG